jgi:hypothetical protein
MALRVQTPMLAIQTKINHDYTRAVPHYRGFFHALYTIPREEGIVRGLWPGMWPNVVKSALNRGRLRRGPFAIIPPTFSFIWRIPIGKTKGSDE